MAATPTTLLIPFKGGLDTFSNPQLLPAGSLTAASGVMLDRPGAAYPGPGFSASAFGAAVSTNHGIAAVAGGPNTNADQLLFWRTDPSDTGPKIGPPPGATGTAPSFPLAPWRQSTQRFQENDGTPVASTLSSMTGAPQCAISGNRAFYVWISGGSSLAMCYQDLTTRLWSGPFTWSANAWNSTGAAFSFSPAQIAVVADSTYLRVAVRIGAAVNCYTYSATNPVVGGSLDLTVLAAANIDNLDSITTGDEAYLGGSAPGCFLLHNSAANKITAFAVSGAALTPSAGVDVLTGLMAATPITGSPVRAQGAASTGFVFAAFVSARRPIFSTTTTALGSVSATTITTNTALAADTPKQLTVANTVSGSAATFAMAIEYKPAAVSGSTWNYVYFASVALAVPGTLIGATGRQGWGGLALLGKMNSWYNGTESRPLVLCRAGWFHNDGTFGTATTAGTATFAYPNGYLYDYTGQLFGKFGDADVGTDSLWPAFNAAGYVPGSLPCLPSGYTFSLATGQQTLSFAWPQYGDVQFFSARTADRGSPIGALAGLATVTWAAPTASEPACPSVQFGTSCVIPGTLSAYYDGSNVFEAGYLHAAPTVTVTALGAGTGSLSTGIAYNVVAVLVYKDASGRVHYSAPSRAVTVTTIANTSALSILVPNTTHTLKAGTTPIGVWLYRNAPSSSVPARLYRLPCAVPLNAGPTGTSSAGTSFLAAVVDGTLDSDLIQNTPIYTSGQLTAAAIGTAAPPPFDSITVWNNQVWGLANRNGPELWCTWPQDFSVFRPEGPAWSPANRIGLPAELGTAKGIIGLDEKLLVFGTRTDVDILGNAPSRDSSIADNPTLFTAGQTLPTPGGCRVLNGLTRLPEGILLQGTQGFVILNRSLSYEPVGMAVKDFSSTNLYLPGVLLPEQNAVLLFSASDATKNLIFFYGTGEWSQAEQPPADTLNSAAAAVVVGSARAVAGQRSSVYVLPSTGAYYAQVASYSQYVSYRTPWINLNGTAVGTRMSAADSAFLREIHVLGTLPNGYPGTQTLTLTTEYDYAGNTLSPTEVQTLSLTTGSQADLDYQWRFGSHVGNCRRIRLTVTVNGGARVSAGNTAPVVLLTGLMLSYDVDTGLSRLGAANSAGT